MPRFDTGPVVETHFSQPPVAPPVTAVRLATDLLAAARQRNERRVLVLSGSEERTAETCAVVLDEIDVGIGDTVAITAKDELRCEHHHPTESDRIMGTTWTVVIVDLHWGRTPNVLGRATGAVDGGGLLVLRCPDLNTWPDRRDHFDEGLIVEPHTIADVGGAFTTRLISTMRTHEGIGIVDVDSNKVIQDGAVTRSAIESGSPPTNPPPSATFAEALYDRCQSRDQHRALSRLESLLSTPSAVLLTAERGRGKSSAAGLAAAGLADHGLSVLVTAPSRTHVTSLMERVTETTAGEAADRVAFREPAAAASAAESEVYDVLIVDEAAGIPVHTLRSLLVADRIAFATTVHGYEGAGQGFRTRFLESLESGRHKLTRCHLREPIRYAPSDPIEAWLAHTLRLDATPPQADVVAEATLSSVTITMLGSDRLAADDRLLGEVIGLLALAHYRTEPDDLARILDAPNLTTVAALQDGHVAAVALCAREGGLSPERSAAAYRGERLRGNMLPDIFVTQLREIGPAERLGVRIVRLATHPSLRRRGLGSALLAHVHNTFSDADWIGTGFGTKPEILDFWLANDYTPIALSTTRNRASGTHSAIMLDIRATDAAIINQLGGDVIDRLAGSLSDVHRTVDPAVVDRLLGGTITTAPLDLDERDWRRVVAAGSGPGSYAVDPAPARRLLLHDRTAAEPVVAPTDASFAVATLLQGRSWDAVTQQFDLESINTARRRLGGILEVLCDTYGGETVRTERTRLAGEGPIDE